MQFTIEMRAKAGKFQELYQTLQALLPTIRKEKGCWDCRVYRDLEDEEAFFLSVHWEARANLEHYVRSSSGSVLLGAVDLLSETARFKFDQDSPWEGIDNLRRMRKKT
jgi:quinol monooxygenase YgiN